VNLIDRIKRPGPKKLLAIDGGGIRGVLALEVLQKIED
jgi:patatin-like phospholipase/acyl hydrolase